MFKVHRRALTWFMSSAGALGCGEVQQKHTGEPGRDTAATCATPDAVWFRDHDHDGYGDSRIQKTGCEAPRGYVDDSTDCDDSDDGVHPYRGELCDGLDQDCDGEVDEGEGETFFRDSDGDGYGDPNLTATACAAPEGYVAAAGDCYDSDPEAHLGSDEVCTGGVDEDCDALVDCEDKACEAHERCVELDCDDGLDGDEDGYTDCDDDDCWGAACPTTIRATVRGGAMDRRNHYDTKLSLSSYCTYTYIWKRLSSVHLKSATGTFRAYGPGGSALRTCDWRVEGAEFYSYYRASSEVAHSGRMWTSGFGTEHTECYDGIVYTYPFHVGACFDEAVVERSGDLTVGPGCGVDAAILPAVLHPVAHGPEDNRAWHDSSGNLWYNIVGDRIAVGEPREILMDE